MVYDPAAIVSDFAQGCVRTKSWRFHFLRCAISSEMVCLSSFAFFSRAAELNPLWPP
jgi:hypothetical protein